jgi:hypothetical protein
MEMRLRGWKRDCGDHVLTQKEITESDVVKQAKSFEIGKIYAIPDIGISPDGKIQNEVKIFFDTNMVANGHFQGELRMSKREIDRLFYLLNEDISWSKLVTRQSEFM